MKISINQVLALALFFTAFIDIYLLPMILLRSPHKSPESIAKKIRILKIAGYISIFFGIIFLLEIIKVIND